MGLKIYRRKRDFRRTPEPAGSQRPSSMDQRRYVIQKHAATRLHYDLRLEDDGVLKSWAVPKGPSLDPKEKRLAVQVEDHPIEYGDFEGTIPKGEYGGGTVLLWDRGRWVPENDPSRGLREGKLKFRLEGEKLRGGWTLVRLRDHGDQNGKPNWLLIKEQDDAATSLSKRDILKERPESVASKRELGEIAAAQERIWHSNRGPQSNKEPSRPDPSQIAGARKGRLPTEPVFQLATLMTEPPLGHEWLHEIKLDGFRMQCRIEKGRAGLFTRTGQDWTHRFESLADGAARLPVQTALLDGEIVGLAPDGRSSFHLLQRALSEGRDATLAYFVFDLLHLDGYDLSSVALEIRKETLKRLVIGTAGHGGPLRYSDHVIGDAAAFHREACRLGLEGMMSKRRQAPYRPGRGRDWIKIKCLLGQEFVVGGFTEPSGSRTGLGALLLGVYGDDGACHYAGRVGTGFNDRMLKELRTRLERLRQDASPFKPVAGMSRKGVSWVRPELVVEVAFAEWTADGILRHPSFVGVREDKLPQEVRRELAGAVEEDPMKHAASTSSRRARARAPLGHLPNRDDAGTEVAGVRLTHPGRILYPAQGVTKLDLARYYEAMAAWILPHVAGRPLMIMRCPEGQEKDCFYQKHGNDKVPAAVHAVDIREESGKKASYLMIDDLPGLVALVQMGVLEVHVWGAKAARLEHPDRMVFDLDPDEGLPWKRVTDGAQAVRSKLRELDLQSWVKTTGGKGLHVVVPLTGKQGWEDVRAFSQAVAESLVKDAPAQYTSKMSKAGRKGKIFIDYLRNSRGATAVAAYSSRARNGATVSVPIRWEDLTTVQPQQLTVKTVPDRLARMKSDPWTEFWSVRQSLTVKARRQAGMK